MRSQDTVAVIGAGVIGTAIAWALSREDRRVLLLDRADPGVAGASYGNVGHIAAELIEPLPSPALLLGFRKELFVRGGPLDVPLQRVPPLLHWFARFGVAAFRRQTNTRHLAPLVRAATATFDRWLAEIGRHDLLRRNGHYEIWLDRGGDSKALAQMAAMQRLDIQIERAPLELLRQASTRAGTQTAAGVWFAGTGHVVDPLEVVRAFALAAIERGAEFVKTDVRSLNPSESGVDIMTANGAIRVERAVVCAGAASARLLEPLGLNVPLASVRGYHIELPQQEPLIDAPVLYANERIFVTPLAGRLRASSYMEFQPPDAPADPRKPRRLREQMRRFGYRCELDGPAWVGSRPTLPDYLPGIGLVPGANVLYAIGHQHIGLTIAPGTAELMADLIAGRPARYDSSAFDLRRF